MKNSFIILLSISIVNLLSCNSSSVAPMEHAEGNVVKIVHQPTSLSAKKDLSSSDSVDMVLGDVIRLQTTVHGSIGLSFDVEYDTTQFKMTQETKYNNPQSVRRGKCGGDRATKTYHFTPLSKGTFTIKGIEDWRGDTANIKTYIVNVK